MAGYIEFPFDDSDNEEPENSFLLEKKKTKDSVDKKRKKMDYPITVPCPEEGELAARLMEVKKMFNEKFGQDPKVFIRVPGRVNLVGEHIDYCGYGVFPMALEQDIIVGVHANTTNNLMLLNCDRQYPEYTCPLENIRISRGDPSWHNYFLCGIQGILDSQNVDRSVGINAVVYGNIPPGAGLSSSSAVVCAAAIAACVVNKVPKTKSELAENCARSERYIGTEGGGMDQAIVLLANKGSAKLIEFNPLRTMDVHLPEKAVFVIANSLAEKNKAASSDYNCRVAECRLAAQVLAHKHGLTWKSIRKLIDLQESLDKTLPQMSDLVREELHSEPYTKQELCNVFGVTSEQLDLISIPENVRRLNSFKLQSRALHVFEEAHRVQEFQRVSESRAANSLTQLGQLMLESHASCRDLYECSHPLVDRLVELSQPHTYGVRLTGAGWGGCVVALVDERNIDTYMRVLRQEFYDNHPHFHNQNFNDVVFCTQPGHGAYFMKG